jgi:hypothetical protein
VRTPFAEILANIALNPGRSTTLSVPRTAAS